MPITRSRVVAIDAGSHRSRVLARRDALVRENMFIVPPIARRLALALPPCFEIDDLIATGNMALIRVATRYRPKVHGGTPFPAYARQRVRGAMIDSVRRRHWEESVREPLKFSFEGDLVNDHHRSPSVEPTVDIDLDNERVHARLTSAVAALPDAQRRIVAAFYAENLPPARDARSHRFLPGRASTVGAALGLPECIVLREMAEAITELRRQLADCEAV